MKKLICAFFLLLGVVSLAAADEVGGVVVSNATTGIVNVRLTFDGIEWNGSDTVEVSGTLMNQGQVEARFVSVDLTLKDAAGDTLAEKTVDSRPQTLTVMGYGEFDALLNCSEKPVMLIYEITGQN